MKFRIILCALSLALLLGCDKSEEQSSQPMSDSSSQTQSEAAPVQGAVSDESMAAPDEIIVEVIEPGLPGEQSTPAATGVTATPTGSGPETDGRGPQTAEKLTIGIYHDAGSVNIWGGGAFSPWVLDAVCEKLMGPNPYGAAPQPLLAEYVKPVTADFMTWEIKLKPGVLWHDGTPLTSEDVKFTIDYNREGPSNNRYSHHTSAVPRLPAEGIEIIDELTLRVTGAFPMPHFDREPCAELPIIQKAQWQDIEDPRQFTGLSIGTGPYRIVDFTVGEYYKLEAFEDYHLGKPLVDKLDLVVIKDFSTMFTALRSGEIDAADRNLPPEMIEEWSKLEHLTILETPYLWGACITLDTANLPFGDPAFREAFTYAIDRDELLEVVGLGRGLSGTLGYPHPLAFHRSPDNAQPYDPDKAAELFTLLGFVDTNADGFRENPDGTPINWRLNVESNQPLYVRAAEIITEHLARIGFRSHVVSLESAAYNEAVNVTGNYDLTVGEFVPHGLADDDMMIVLQLGEIKNDIGPWPEREAAIEAWKAASTVEDRRQATYALQELINKHPKRVMLWYPYGYFAYNKNSYDNYSILMGEGDLFSKYSFLPNEVRAPFVYK